MNTRPPSPLPGEFPGASASPDPLPDAGKTESAAPPSPPPDPPAPEAPATESAAPPSDTGKLPGGDSAHRVEAVPHVWSNAEQKIAAVLAENIGLLIGRPQTLNWGSLNDEEKIPLLSVARKITSIK